MVCGVDWPVTLFEALKTIMTAIRGRRARSQAEMGLNREACILGAPLSYEYIGIYYHDHDVNGI